MATDDKPTRNDRLNDCALYNQEMAEQKSSQPPMDEDEIADDEFLLREACMQQRFPVPEILHPLGERVADQDDLVAGVQFETARRGGGGEGRCDEQQAGKQRSQAHGVLFNEWRKPEARNLGAILSGCPGGVNQPTVLVESRAEASTLTGT